MKLPLFKTLLLVAFVGVFVALPLTSVLAAGIPTSGVLKGVRCAASFTGSVGGADTGSGLKTEAKGFALCTPCDLVVVVGNISDMMVAASGAIAVLIFVYAGILYLTAGYKPDHAGKAKSAATNAIIGLVLIFGAYSIVTVVLRSLGGVSDAGAFNTAYTKITGKPLTDWGVCNLDIDVAPATTGGAPAATTPAASPAPERQAGTPAPAASPNSSGLNATD